MSNSYFQFKQFTIWQERAAMKVTTDACLFGAWVAAITNSEKLTLRQAQGNNCLDIGTGTGLLALMYAQKDPTTLIDTLEIDKYAFEQAFENISASPWSDRIQVIHTDAKEFVSTHKYDIILSNPPFYENELKSDDKNKNIAHHSDALALHELLSIIKKKLQPGGSFYLLLPYKRHKEIRELMLQNEFTITQMILVRQSVNHDFFRIMLAGKFKADGSGETMVEEIAITDNKGQYTSGFVSLLKDYYLRL
ncbi:MAG TPA: methyltransferase [Chitinophagaceae bacterium]|nr:methyltransferase [Chitinophagaceae bacterium]